MAQQEELKPGDRIVELAALVHAAAMVSGAVGGAWSVWLIKSSWLASAAAFLAGAAIGFVAAKIIARLVYRTAEGHTTVVKVGIASLSSTIPAGLVGSVTSAVLVALAVLLLVGAMGQAAVILGVTIGCGVVLGVILAGLSSLT